MNFFVSIKNSIQKGLEKRREDNERMNQIRKEVDMERRRIFEEQFKIQALEAAKKRAYKDAARLSGMQKLRAENRLRRLNESSSVPMPGSFFEKLRDYTTKNIARREENLKRTEEVRKQVETLRQGKIIKMNQRKNSGFGNSKWKP